jgi:peptidoglycan LD-endopeptidase LytH
MRPRRRRTVPIVALFLCFCAGMVAMWALLHYGPPQPAAMVRLKADTPDEHTVPPKYSVGSSKEPVIGSPPPPEISGTAATSGDIPHGRLRPPIDGNDPASWQGGFAERRGSRPHEAVDILAPRNTPIHAVEDGVIAKLFNSKAGGLTVYQFDPTGRLCYYYAHLERYAEGLQEGERVMRGQLIGYVGTSGNAPPNTPHLHFAVFQLDAERRWWQGTAIDPYLVFHH